ncbi:hypothetical protein AAVH_22342, partial [Aphelenchoides avenae]
PPFRLRHLDVAARARESHYISFESDPLLDSHGCVLADHSRMGRPSESCVSSLVHHRLHRQSCWRPPGADICVAVRVGLRTTHADRRRLSARCF